MMTATMDEVKLPGVNYSTVRDTVCVIQQTLRHLENPSHVPLMAHGRLSDVFVVLLWCVKMFSVFTLWTHDDPPTLTISPISEIRSFGIISSDTYFISIYHLFLSTTINTIYLKGHTVQET